MQKGIFDYFKIVNKSETKSFSFSKDEESNEMDIEHSNDDSEDKEIDTETSNKKQRVDNKENENNSSSIDSTNTVAWFEKKAAVEFHKKLIRICDVNKDTGCMYYTKSAVKCSKLFGRGRKLRKSVRKLLYEFHVKRIVKQVLYNVCPGKDCINPLHVTDTYTLGGRYKDKVKDEHHVQASEWFEKEAALGFYQTLVERCRVDEVSGCMFYKLPTRRAYFCKLFKGDLSIRKLLFEFKEKRKVNPLMLYSTCFVNNCINPVHMTDEYPEQRKISLFKRCVRNIETNCLLWQGYILMYQVMDKLCINEINLVHMLLHIFYIIINARFPKGLW